MATDAPPTHTPQPPTATPSPTPIPSPTVTPPAHPLDRFEQGKRLGRGVNLGNALEAPVEGEWGMVLEEEFFTLIAEAGFNTIRVPIRWSAHALEESPYTIDETFFQRVDWVIDNATANNLNVVINMHHYNELFQKPADHKARFVAIWQQIVLRYRERPDNLYFEPLNEPNSNLSPDAWNSLLAQTVTEIRHLDKFHTIVIDGAEWGGITGMMKLKVPEGEENYVCSFHYYEPFPFTHQGAEWSSDPLSVGVQWPGPPATPFTPDPASLELSWLKKWYEDYNKLNERSNPASAYTIQKDLDWAVMGSEKLDCPLWMGEFGAYSKADMDSRVRWTTTLREEAEKRGMAWSYWEFGSGFGAYDRSLKKWNQGLLEALIPPQ
ncbi:MAG: glycoside hydrolase family 5 protein [Anaerolineae bacterium]|nr:glycoside hydrolase family 5 protein [Anaerolineae bacterium]